MKNSLLLAGLLVFSLAFAQEDEPDTPSDDPSAAEEAEEIDDAGLDEQGFEEEDDDDFVPTEDIPTDQSIPFPTDI